MDEQEKRIAVLIVEDHPIFQDALRGFIEIRDSDFVLVGCTDAPEEALAIVEQCVPNVVLLDLELHRKEDAGQHLITQIRDISPETKVLVLTAHRENELVFAAIRAGAVSYLLKENVRGNDVADYIIQVHQGAPPIDPDIAQKLWSYFQGRHSSDEQGIRDLPKLTAREQEVLDLIVKGMSNLEIAEALTIALTTVKTHVRNILQKLHLSNRTELRMMAAADLIEKP